MTKETASINVLFLSAEADPLIKIGGLGDVAGTLPLAINRISGVLNKSMEVRVAIPFHPIIKDKNLHISFIGSFSMDSAGFDEKINVYEYEHENTIFYLLDGTPIQNSPSAYSNDSKLDAAKYAFFSLAAIHLPKFLNWNVDIIHANDWHTALAIFALKKVEGYKNEEVKTIISIHNLPFLGTGMDEAELKYGIPEYEHPFLPGWSRRLPLPKAIATADLIIPVSPGYAQEIQTSDFGCGLENLLIHRKDQIVGILNGIDTTTWNPATDTLLPSNYDFDTIDLKRKNKAALQLQVSLKITRNIPVMGIVSRLDYQKGIDLIIESLYKLKLTDGWQCIFLGTGDPYLELQIRNLEKAMPLQVRGIYNFDPKFAHLIYAGADIFLMPSRYEPCGISQMISQRYGTIPLARSTGGLKDTIIQTVESYPGTGYLFEDLNPIVFSSKIGKTLADFHKKKFWNSIIQKAMAQDFSWDKSAVKYIDEYERLIQ